MVISVGLIIWAPSMKSSWSSDCKRKVVISQSKEFQYDKISYCFDLKKQQAKTHNRIDYIWEYDELAGFGETNRQTEK